MNLTLRRLHAMTSPVCTLQVTTPKLIDGGLQVTGASKLILIHPTAGGFQWKHLHSVQGMK